MRCRSSAAIGLAVVMVLIVASPVLAATLGVTGSTLTLDASGETGESELGIAFEPLEDRLFFSAASSGMQAGPGCELRSDTVACPFEGVATVEVRGPRLASSTIDLTGLIRREGTTPSVVGSVDAGARGDKIDTVNDVADTISCGPGLDAFRADARDTVQADCETANQEGPIRARLLPGSDTAVRAARKVGAGDRVHPYGIDFRISCPPTAPDDSCGGKLDVFVAEPSSPKGRGLFGSQVYAVARGKSQRLRVLVGFGAADGQTAASYSGQIQAMRNALKKRGRARMRAQIRSGSARFQHRFSVTSIRTP
jgi:hypothetical protein